MAAANSTTEGNQKRITEMYCSAEFIGEVDSELIFLSVLNSLVYYRIFGQRAYPSRSSQGIFASSSIQTPVS